MRQMFDVLKRSPGLCILMLYDLVLDDTQNQDVTTITSVEISLPVLESLTLHGTGLAFTKSLMCHEALPNVREITPKIVMDSERTMADLLTTSAKRYLQDRPPTSIWVVDLANSFLSCGVVMMMAVCFKVHNLTRDIKSRENMLLCLEGLDLNMLSDLCVIVDRDLSADWRMGILGKTSALEMFILDGPVNPTGLISGLTLEKTV